MVAAKIINGDNGKDIDVRSSEDVDIMMTLEKIYNIEEKWVCLGMYVYSKLPTILDFIYLGIW